MNEGKAIRSFLANTMPAVPEEPRAPVQARGPVRPSDADTAGEVRYQFTGRYALAQAEAMRAILLHEKIDFMHATGPTGLAIVIRKPDEPKVKAIVQQWYEALHSIHTAVWSERP